MKLHDTLRKIYNKIINLNFIEVLSNDGWQEVQSLNIGSTDKLCVITMADGNTLKCTMDHILFNEDGEEIFAKDTMNKYIVTNNGLQIVSNVKLLDKKSDVYDLSLKTGTTHTYFTNNILSHNCIICDEFAFLNRNLADKLFTSMYPTISSSKEGKFIIVSTPNGTDNLYYDIWQQANAKDKSKNLDGWTPFTMYWWQVPGHDEVWKTKQIAAIGERRFAQEFNNEFLANSGTKTLISGDILTKYRMKLSEFKAQGIIPKKQKIVSQDETEVFDFDMWHEFQPSHTYAASGDISEGVGGDASVLYVWDVTDLQNIVMCAKFSSNTVSLVQFAYITSKILALYNNPPFAAERNGVSAGTLDSLKITYGYSNIVIENKRNEAGIFSHITVKEKACVWCKEMMETRGFGFTIYDKDLIDEFGIFCKKDSKGMHMVYQALPGQDSHDDHVMAFVWLTYILNNERINTYFNPCTTFTSDFGVIYPRILQPLTGYTTEEWEKISNDPLYKDFIEYKNECLQKLNYASIAEQHENENDAFKYITNSSPNDIYFNDDDGESWNTPSRPRNNIKFNHDIQSQLNKNYTKPTFFIL